MTLPRDFYVINQKSIEIFPIDYYQRHSIVKYTSAKRGGILEQSPYLCCKRLWSPGIESEESIPGFLKRFTNTGSVYGGEEASRNKVVVPARQATMAGGIDSWSS